MEFLTGWIIPAAVILLAVVLLLAVKYAASRYKKISPNQIGVFYGKNYGKDAQGNPRKFLVLSGGGRVQMPIVESYQEMSKLAFQITIDEDEVPNKDNVKLRVRGIASCKLSDALEEQMLAVEQFLGQNDQAIQVYLGNILKGHLRAIIGKMNISELLRDRAAFNQNVITESMPEIKSHGYELKGVAIQDINDKEGYIDALGKQAVADAKADAEIKISDAAKKQAVQVSNNEREAANTKAENAAQVALAEKERDVKKAGYKTEADTALATAEMAGPIAKAVQEQKLRVAEAERDAAQAEAQVDVQNKKQKVRVAELNATVVAQAEADRTTQTIAAEAAKAKRIIDATAEAESLTLTAEARKQAAIRDGEGTAAATEANLVATARGKAAEKFEVLSAEARGTRELADALKQMSDKAQMIIILDKLPALMDHGGDAMAKVAEAIFKSVAAPLGQIDKLSIVDVGGSGNGVNKIAGLVPQIVFEFMAKAKAQGLDVEGLMKKVGVDTSGISALLSGIGAGTSTTALPSADAVSSVARTAE